MSALARVSLEEGGGDEVIVARVSGELDLASAPTVGDQLAGAVPNSALGLVVDLTETTYLDSSGLSLIFDLSERLRRRQQKMCLVVPEDAPLRRVLDIVNAGETVPILGTAEEAADRIRAAPPEL